MKQLSPSARAESGLMTAGDLLRGTVRLLWYAPRLPVLMFLAILEPVVRFILGALALLGVLTALFFNFYGVPHFPFALMLGVSVGFGSMLAGYYALLRVLGR
jgi:hypothetical protein